MKPRWLQRFLVVSSAAATLVAISPLRAQQGATGAEWRAYAGDLGATKYSPLTQIDATSFSTLTVAWRWQFADGFLSRTIPGRGEVWASSRLIFDQLKRDDPKRWRDGQFPLLVNFKATPLMVGGRLYHLFGAIPAHCRTQHRHHAGIDLVVQRPEGTDSRLDARLGCSNWKVEVDVSHDPDTGRIRQRDMEGRFLVVHRKGQRLGDVQRRRRTGVRVRPAQHRRASLLRR